MPPRAAAAYGQLHASAYDRIYGAQFDTEQAVTALAAAAADGAVLELGVGTGRLAIPLTGLGVTVDGLEASESMIASLRALAGGDRVGVLQADLADFDLPRHDYHVAVCAVSTLFILDHAAQRTCVVAASGHLRPGGRLFIEAFNPDPTRFDEHGTRTEHRPAPGGGTHTVTSTHDAAGSRIHIVHTLTDVDGRSTDYPVTLNYSTPEQIDEMASSAGLTLAGRWADWTGTPADEHTRDPISIYLA